MKWRRPIVYGLLILGLVAVTIWIFPRFSGPGVGARPSVRAKAQIAVFKTVLNAFAVDNGFYPKSLEELLVPLPTSTNWHGPYLDGTAVPLDPWGQPYLYTHPGKHETNAFDLMSAGRDGQAGTEDDITNWQPKR